MRVAHGFVVVSLALTACSLLTPLDGLTGGSTTTDGGGAPDDAAIGDATGSNDAGSNDDAAGNDDAADAADAGPIDCSEPGLVAAWLFDEGAGNVIRDCAGRGIDGIRGGPTGGSIMWGKRGASTCLEVNGPSAPITMGGRSELAITSALTLAGWIRSDLAPDSYVSVAWKFDGKGFEITLDNFGQLYAQLGLGDGTAAKMAFPALTVGRWTHVAAVFEPAIRFELFVDGVSTAKRTDVASPTLSQSATDFRIGILGDGASWKGGIDDVKVYARALDAAAIAALAKP